MSSELEKKHIDVLDGIRVYAIIWVCFYHFWLESWLTPYIDMKAKWPRYLGINSIEIAAMLRFGYIFVDLVMVLSAFCNFLPYARSILLGEAWPDTKEFYKKRAIRIMPSYYLTVFFFLFAYALPNHKYTSMGFMWKDLITHLTFTSWMFPDTCFMHNSNGVLWTVQVEVMFYIVIPWVAKLFKKWPEITYFVMLLIGIISSNFFLNSYPGDFRAVENHPIAYTGLYANGILLSCVYVRWKMLRVDNRYTRIAGTAVSIGCIIFFRKAVQWFMDMDNKPAAKLKYRLVLSAVFCLFVFATTCASRAYQWIFSNRFVKWFNLLTYNYYIWHQGVARFFKAIRIPYWEGEELPNMAGNVGWMYRFTALSIVMSVVVAAIVTYCYDIPITERLIKKYIKVRVSEGENENT